MTSSTSESSSRIRRNPACCPAPSSCRPNVGSTKTRASIHTAKSFLSRASKNTKNPILPILQKAWVFLPKTAPIICGITPPSKASRGATWFTWGSATTTNRSTPFPSKWFCRFQEIQTRKNRTSWKTLFRNRFLIGYKVKNGEPYPFKT